MEDRLPQDGGPAAPRVGGAPHAIRGPQDTAAAITRALKSAASGPFPEEVRP